VRALSVLALLVLLLGPANVSADEIGPAQAQALQQHLRDWTAGLLGPAVRLPEATWQASADHDHYIVTWPLPGLTAASAAPAVTANVRPLDGNRWSVDALTVPASGSFTATLPQDEPPLTAQFSIGQQDTHGVLDTALASESYLHSELSDIWVKSEGARQQQEQRFDRYVADTRLTPTQGGRLNLLVDGTVHGWNSASQIEAQNPIAVGIQTVHAVGQVNEVNRDRVASLLAAAGGVIGSLPPSVGKQGDNTDTPPAVRAQLRLVIESLPEMLSSVRLEETLDGVQMEIAGVGSASIKRTLLGMGGESIDGRLHAWINLALDELASPSLPPEFAAYLPHHVEIKPSLSGVLTADLHKLALDETEPGESNDRFAPDLAAMFAHGGIKLGLETLAFDLGAARVQGTGEITVSSPTAWHGEAHLQAVGYDELTAQARTSPELQPALPALIMLRGLAKQEGERLVWNVVSDGSTTTVNGLDLSQLSGGDRPRPKPPSALKPGQPSSR
jgi:hypothetical protein